ncbi:MAG: hypothetical protein RO257_10120 [Candidatus Kapabacteria bacterium]|nr:hypothetical protein [Candidatus Kapabacteria bacterium]
MMWDDEVKDLRTTQSNEGVGNSCDFGARMLDTRVGRFFSLDPMKLKYPGMSLYLFAADNPILNIDKEDKWAAGIHYNIMVVLLTDFIIMKRKQCNE